MIPLNRDAACRVVIPSFAVPVDARISTNGGRCGVPRNGLPAMPTVGAEFIFAARRFLRCLSSRDTCALESHIFKVGLMLYSVSFGLSAVAFSSAINQRKIH